MLVGNTVEVSLIKQLVMYGRAAFIVLSINLFYGVFAIGVHIFWTSLDSGSVGRDLNPGQELVILEEVVLGVLPALLELVQHDADLIVITKVEDIDV